MDALPLFPGTLLALKQRNDYDTITIAHCNLLCNVLPWWDAITEITAYLKLRYEIPAHIESSVIAFVKKHCQTFRAVMEDEYIKFN